MVILRLIDCSHNPLTLIHLFATPRYCQFSDNANPSVKFIQIQLFVPPHRCFTFHRKSKTDHESVWLGFTVQFFVQFFHHRIDTENAVRQHMRKQNNRYHGVYRSKMIYTRVCAALNDRWVDHRDSSEQTIST